MPLKPRFRASKTPIRLSCFGSGRVEALVGERVGDDGEVGSWLHYKTADRLVREDGASAPDGLTPPVVSPEFKTPKDSLWVIDWCVRFARETIPADWSLLVEVALEWEFERWIGTGHGDFFAFSPDGTEMIGGDWKTVYLAVERAEFNDQVLMYIVLAKLNWPELRKITFYVLQPRMSDDNEDERRITWVTLEGAELDACVASLDARVCHALDHWRKLKSGAHCKWCVGLKCPCLQKELGFMELELTDEVLASLKGEPDDATLARLQFSARTLAKPLEDLEKIVKDRLEDGRAIVAPDGRSITKETSNAGIKVTDPIGYSRAVRVLVPDEDQLALATSYSIAPLVSIIAERTGRPKGGKSGTSARDELNATTAPFYEVRTKQTLKYSL